MTPSRSPQSAGILLRPSVIHLLLCGLLSLQALSASAARGVCGMPDGIQQDASDLANGTSDLSLSRIAEQPAGLVTCSMGYMAEKCGDHATALKIFDKCIARGYAGAMIWKGLMYENGNGLPRDDAKAAALFKQAAESGEGHYGALGKLHFASALQQGKGVPKDEVEAHKWFEQAAREGSEDAAEFLRTGYHTGSRDVTGRGVGVPTETVQGQALVRQEKPAATTFSTWQRLLLAACLVTLMLAGAFHQCRWRSAGNRAPQPVEMPDKGRYL
jgi:hypothetical protein